MRTVAITGASGFIGRHLARRLREGGTRVIAVVRSDTAEVEADLVHSAALGESLLPLLEREKVDAIVHAANHVGPDEYEVNVEGTRRWFEESKAQGVELQILLSTLSAGPDSTTGYTRAKYELEQMFLGAGEVAFRLAVVVGNGGMFERIRRSLANAKLTPLLDNGTPRIYVLGIEFLCNVLRDCIMSGGNGLRGRAWRLQQPTPYTLRDVAEVVRSHFGYRTRFVPLPSLPILWLLRVIERMPLRLPISSSNLTVMRQTRHRDFESDFDHFGYPERTLEDLVAAAASEFRRTST